MTLFKLLKCTVAKPPICCSRFCNEQLNKNVKCGKLYFTLNVSNIVMVIFKSFITICWEKNLDKKKKKKTAYKIAIAILGEKKKSQLHYFPKSFSPRMNHKVSKSLKKSHNFTSAYCETKMSSVSSFLISVRNISQVILEN